jgi:hypothetical protein
VKAAPPAAHEKEQTMTSGIARKSLRTLEPWSAARDETRRLPPGRDGLTIRVEEGLLLVTQAGDRVDHVLGPGEELRLDGRGLGVAWALEPARALIVRGRDGQGRAGRGPAMAA